MRRVSPLGRLDPPKRFAGLGFLRLRRREAQQNAARRGFGVNSEPNLTKIYRSV